MRGRTYLFNVTQVAAAVEKSTGSKLSAEDVAARAADIVDATFREMKARNLADAVKAADANLGGDGFGEAQPESLHTADDILNGLGDDES